MKTETESLWEKFVSNLLIKFYKRKIGMIPLFLLKGKMTKNLFTEISGREIGSVMFDIWLLLQWNSKLQKKMFKNCRKDKRTK